MCPDRGQMQTIREFHFLSVRLYNETSFSVRIVMPFIATSFANEILSIVLGKFNGGIRKTVTIYYPSGSCSSVQIVNILYLHRGGNEDVICHSFIVHVTSLMIYHKVYYRRGPFKYINCITLVF